MDTDQLCVLCEGSLANGQVVVVGKGISTIISASKERGDDKWKCLEGQESVSVHVACRKQYTRGSSIKSSAKTEGDGKNKPSTPIKSKLRALHFDFKTMCFLCAEECDETAEKKKPYSRRQRISQVTTLSVMTSVLKRADERNDDWGKQVRSRVQSVLCLFAADGVYHRSCYADFFSNEPTDNESGRPEIPELSLAFARLCEEIESTDECQYSLNYLIDKMEGYVPTKLTMKAKLLEKYGDGIFISSISKHETVICFRNTGNKILTNAWYHRKEDNAHDERLRIVRTAAALVREDIRSQAYDLDNYPPATKFMEGAESAVPESLDIFLKEVIVKNKKGNEKSLASKCTTIAHAIISACRPRSFLSQIQIGIAVYLHRKFGSKTLLDILSHVGLCATYGEAVLYESSAMTGEPPEVRESFSQFVFDNADVNVNTLDGLGTFHSMGGIQCVTPATAVLSDQTISRLKLPPSATALAQMKKVPIKTFEHVGKAGMKDIRIDDLNSLRALQTEHVLPSNHDLLWMIGNSLCVPQLPGWNGFMEVVTKHIPYEMSRVVCLPFLNLKPSSYDAINSVLHFAADECKKIGQTTCFVTFDQPLYIKARDIVATYSKDGPLANIVVRLGGFHLLMSFMGSIGYIMAGSGLKELWSVIYAPLVADKMLTGHAYSRALRGHFLTQLVIANIILRDIPIPDDQGNAIKDVLNQFHDNPIALESINETQIIESIAEALQEQLQSLKLRGRTAQLWVQYFNLINLLRQFIRAERMGNWQLHLDSVHKMLPYFHAAGHFPYAKSCHLYVQDMYALADNIPAADYQKFVTDGHFTIRRSDKFWAGLWTDLTIEQTLMRMMKSCGGLTRGRGLTDSVLNGWILSMPATFEVCRSVEDFSGVSITTTEQHVDLRESRVTRDNADTHKLLQWFESHPPFPDVMHAMSIATGLVGDETVNCYDAYTAGVKAIDAMIGNNFEDIKLKRSSRVVTLISKTSSIKVHGSNVPVETTLLFQRIVCTVKKDEELAECFHYELAPLPLSLFDEEGLRKTKKSALYNLFIPENEVSISYTRAAYVIDGGFLLHRVVWPQNATYCEIFAAYINYLHKHYGTDLVVVFDGYTQSASSTKHAERHRRSVQLMSAEVVFDDSMTPTTSQDKFLANEKNKTRFIAHLCAMFQDAGIGYVQAIDDADTLIIKTALEMASTKDNVFVVGQDIDLLVLLLAHTPCDINISFIKPGTGKLKTKVYSSKHIQSSLPYVKPHILFLHAVSGCDTTSAFFRKGKVRCARLLQKRDDLQMVANIFNNVNASQEVIADAGERFTLALYGAPPRQVSLNSYRYQCFSKSVVRCKTKVLLSAIPPTSAAAREHSFRVYHQVQQWHGHRLPPEGWGWESTRNGYIPIPTREPPAPEKLLQLISCNCSKGCDRGCGCQKAGLRCSPICGYCLGSGCSNSPAPETSEIEMSNDNDDNPIQENFESVSDNDDDDSDSDHEHNDETIAVRSPSPVPGCSGESRKTHNVAKRMRRN